MFRFRLYKLLFKVGKRAVYRLPLSTRFRNKILLKIRKQLPKNVDLLKGTSSPIITGINGEDFTLNFREKDEGDLAIVKCSLRGDLYEPEIISNLKNILKGGESVIDGGAHIGYLSLAFSTFLGSDGRIFSFEPFDASFDLLEKNVKDNNKLEIIRPIKKGLWNSKEGLDLAVPENRSVSVSCLDSSEVLPLKRVHVETTDLDSFCEENRFEPSLIKLDLEGAEIQALKGAKKILKKSHPFLIVEVKYEHCIEMGLSIKDLLDPLMDSGYETCVVLSENPDKNIVLSLPSDVLEIEKQSHYGHVNCLFQ